MTTQSTRGSSTIQLILSCEHGGNKIPKGFRQRLKGTEAVRKSHRGYDYGALTAARFIEKKLAAPLVNGETTRLAIDLNRSESNPEAFSKWTRDITKAEQDFLVQTVHRPYWSKALALATKKQNGLVLHASIHSFTGVLKGIRRNADVGVLFDPRRKNEAKYARALKTSLNKMRPGLRIRMNYPYKGTSDGLVQSFRARLPPSEYAGLEIEINQFLIKRLQKTKRFAAFLDDLSEAMKQALEEL